MAESMNTRTVLAMAAGAIFLVALASLAKCQNEKLSSGLPPLVECNDRDDAMTKAVAWVVQHNGDRLISVLGTGSMAPYIPAAPQGKDPLKTVVAILVTKKDAKFEDIKAGDLVTYAAPLSYYTVTHVAARKVGSGWVMSGIHNKVSDVIINESSFRYIIAASFVWPQ